MTRRLPTRVLGVVVLVSAVLLALMTRVPSPASADDPVTLSTATPSLAVGQPLTFSYAAPADQVYATNWIGLFQGKGCVSPSTHWLYTANGSSSTPSTAVASGTVTFDTTGWAAGSYSVCFLADDGYAVIGGPLTVRLLGPGVSVDSTTVPEGTPVTVSYLAPDDRLSIKNWIGWYRGKTTCGTGSTYWDYTQTGTQVPPPDGTAPVASGSVTFTGMSVGSYTVCLLYDDGYTLIGTPVVVNVVDAANSVTVTSSGHGTASASPLSAKAGQTVTLTESPEVGYRFSGWHVTQPADGSLVIGADGRFTMPRTPVSVEAEFAADRATLHFDGNGADSGSMTDQSVQYDVPVALEANAFTLAGSDFAGWATSPFGPVTYADGGDFTDQVPTDGATVTLFARWRPPGQYLVAIDDVDHGTGTASVGSALPGAPVVLSATADTGYHTAGWTVVRPDGLGVGSDGTFAMPATDVEVAPRLQANAYRVVYHGNGADAGSTDESHFIYDTPDSLTPDGFVRDGYRFAGWSTTPGGAVAYADQATVQNLTAEDGGVVDLYARWTELSVQAGDWPSLPRGFVSDTFKLPAVTASGAISQPLLGLWNGAVPAFTKASGDPWLRVSPDGTVTGTAPDQAPKDGGEITVSATSGATTSRILVEVPVAGSKASPELAAATWNAWQSGSHVDDAVGKNLAVVAARGLGVLGFQDGGYRMAQSVGAALGWSVHGLGDLGIVSSYPRATGDRAVFPTAEVPGAAETVSVGGEPVRIWDVHLDEADYGPYAACFAGRTAAQLVSGEKSSTRYAQAQAVAQAVAADARTGTPVVLLGDLASPAATDWTARTSARHCGIGAVDWPVPGVLTRSGLVDSYRSAHPDPSTDPGTTWSPVLRTNANGQAEPQDRIDYVDYTASGLTLTSSDAMWLGWPSQDDPSGNSWASDHAAVVSRFVLGGARHVH
jgi:uncharacterized repeat protein (TIGR02543 family)